MDHKPLLAAMANCIAACEYCADACLGEDDVKKMVNCIRTDRDCADVCRTAYALVARNSQDAKKIVALCAELCRKCEKECRQHEAKHCQQCADACQACAEACDKFAG